MKDRLTVLLLGIVAVALAGVCVIARQKGAIVLATPGAELQLAGQFGSDILLRSGAQPIAVLARAYRPTSLTLTGEQDGATWQLRSGGPWGRLARINLPRGRTTALEVGPPLQIKPRVEMYPGQVRIGLRLFGRAGEMYQNSILKNNQRVSRPEVRILDEAGTLLASGQFQYG
jgi:hypothetical protein